MNTELLPAPAAMAPVSAVLPVTRDVGRLRVVMVNVYFVGDPETSNEWVLVDAGMPRSAGTIRRAAEARYGRGARPRAIVLTHGHFDHVGALEQLAEEWDVPVYSHELELPYITGRSSYPPPDPTVGGGMMARLSPLYPRGPYNVGGRAMKLPDDGSVPHLPGWRWVFTPGHTPGHVALFRESDRLLLAGDAFVTTKQESATAVLTQRREIHGPPMYYTTDWPAARESVRRLEALHPRIAATGHGEPIGGTVLAHGLHQLARDFDHLAMPRDGRYVRRAAISDLEGVVDVPPPVADPVPKLLIVGVMVAGALAAISMMRGRDDDRS